ncbi:MAG: beta-lactamase family protein [Gemmatimonadales bacterium]|nr:beta-lactamase family protein [Gemmatimonadales bacterium]
MSQAPTARPDSPDFAAIDAYVTQSMASDRVPGVAIAIVHGDSIVHLRGFGHDGRGNPVTGETGFVLGSMSKAFTALAVMQLVERQQVDLDAPVQRYLPWFRVADSAASAAITVRQLLLHTSGIPTRAPRARGDTTTLADHVRALASVSLANPPGTTHQYASPNYMVLGAIIEAVTGRPFGAYVNEEIFAPLEMRHSFADASRAGMGLSRGHVYALGFPVATDLPHEHDRLPTAALIASAGDMGQFLVAQLNRGQYADRRVLSDTSMTLMHTGGAPSEAFSYAFGWREGAVGGTRAVHHGGIVSNYRGKMVLLPDLQWGVVVLTNISSAIPFPIAPTSHVMADAIAAHLAGVPLPPAGSRHAVLFFGVAAVMLLVLAGQIRGLVRAVRNAMPRATRAAMWRASALDVVFVVLVAGFAPRFAGASSWPAFLRIAPDVGWWLAMVAALSVATVVARFVPREPGLPEPRRI